MPNSDSDHPAPMNREWNYHPELPLHDPSVFQWPPRAGFLLRWLVRNWLTLSERMMLLIVAIVAYVFLYPSLERAATFTLGWILQVWAVNFALVAVVAGGLHYWFYTRASQGKMLKFDARDPAKNNRSFLFADQVHDNMFWSLGSGVAVISGFQVLTMWMMANGYAPTLTFAANPIWFVAGIVLLPIWSAFHFYWVHRLLHVRFFYRHFHSLHHKNINIGPWSGLSMHPVEHLMYMTTICIHWIVASHPIHLIYHILYQGPGAAMTHTGYEDMLIKDKRRLALGTFYHQLHHRYFECNYGNQEMPWDRWFGTFHDGRSEATAETRARKKRMYQ